MDKNCKPTDGVPVSKFLEEDHDAGPFHPRRPMGGVRPVVDQILWRLNVGTCATEAQVDEIHGDLLELLDGETGEDEAMEMLIQRANGFRLDCKNCLNSECEERAEVSDGKEVKNCKPTDGVRIKFYLEQINKYPDQYFHRGKLEILNRERFPSDIRNVVRPVIPCLNLGTCATVAQAFSLRTVFRSYMEDEIGSEEAVNMLVQRVNGFRLECGNCLNLDCKERPKDPEAMQLAGVENVEFGWVFYAGTCKILQNAGLRNLRDISKKTRAELSLVKGVGKQRLKEIEEVLAEYGLSLSDSTQ